MSVPQVFTGYGTTGPNLLLMEGTPHRFRRRVFLSILALSVLTATITGAVFYSLQGTFIAADRARRASTLLTSLATQAELGAYASQLEHYVATVNTSLPEIQNDISLGSAVAKQYYPLADNPIAPFSSAGITHLKGTLAFLVSQHEATNFAISSWQVK